ncbi:MAG TPA: hypothetical protein VIE65_16415 [Methylobacter sp.]|jgi:flagellar export protein FliJ
MKVDKIQRLIEIKENEIEGLRIDLFRLNKLVGDMQVRLNNILSEKEEFVAQAVNMESAERYILPHQMISNRDYIAHLLQKVLHAEKMRDEVTNQRDLARSALEKIHIEMKSLEMVAKRKSKLIEIDQSRKRYLASDDEEILRSERARLLNAEH